MKMIDLHIHTVFSDGNIEKLDAFFDNEIISITDHNSIMAYKNLTLPTSVQYIMGTEITIVGLADHLIYFPNQKYNDEIEKRLSSIRIREEYIHQAYQLLGYDNWERDKKLSISEYCKVCEAKTSNLAAIIYKYRRNSFEKSNLFEKEDLKLARKLRRQVSDKLNYILNPMEPFEIAKEFGGIVVLAHPIHTSLKLLRKEELELDRIKKELTDLFNRFYSRGGRYIEWEYFNESYIERHGVTMYDINNIRELILIHARDKGFDFTIGSDSHDAERYDDAKAWIVQQASKIHMPSWID